VPSVKTLLYSDRFVLFLKSSCRPLTPQLAPLHCMYKTESESILPLFALHTIALLFLPVYSRDNFAKPPLLCFLIFFRGLFFDDLVQACSCVTAFFAGSGGLIWDESVCPLLRVFEVSPTTIHNATLNFQPSRQTSFRKISCLPSPPPSPSQYFLDASITLLLFFWLFFEGLHIAAFYGAGLVFS